jgi:hypothetical protein
MLRCTELLPHAFEEDDDGGKALLAINKLKMVHSSGMLAG